MAGQRETLKASFLPAGTTLVASQGSDGLCLEAAWGAEDQGSGACGFRDSPTGGRYMVSGTRAGFMYAYGPFRRTPERFGSIWRTARGSRRKLRLCLRGWRKDGTS
jgi:hypothetical protein